MEKYIDKFLKWYAQSPLASYARAFLTIVASFAVADFAKAGYFDFTNWQLWLIAGLVALVPTTTRVLNSKDPLQFQG